MKIDDPEYVLHLWAASVRPRIRMFQHPEPDRKGPTDDRRWQAKCKVESIPGFLKARPVLQIVYVNEVPPNDRDLAVVENFKLALAIALESGPIIVEDDERVTADFFVSVGQALLMLRGAGTPISERKLMDILPWITSYKQGRQRLVRWSEVVAHAPRKRSQQKGQTNPEVAA